MVKRYISKGKQFILHDLWRDGFHDLNTSRKVLLHTLQIIVLSLRETIKDKCQLRASALTFYSMLSLVPIAALFFAVAKGFGMEEKLRVEMLKKFAEHDKVVEQVFEFAEKMLDNTRGGMLAGIGVVVLLWTIIKVVGNVEHSFNDIWGIKHPRSIIRKFTDYISALIVFPILLILSSSMTLTMSTKAGEIINSWGLGTVGGPLLSVGMKLIPFITAWVLFTAVYIFIPNTKVKFMAALKAGIVAGTAFQIWQIICVLLQVGVSKYNAIYGSFSALPIFMIWLQWSWLIVLLGAEVAYVTQNFENLSTERAMPRLNVIEQRNFGLLATLQVIRHFCAHNPPMTVREVGIACGLPYRIASILLSDLESVDVIDRVVLDDSGKGFGYRPAVPLSELTIGYVVEHMDHIGGDRVELPDDPEVARLKETIEKLYGNLLSAGNDVKLADL
jgi:membrane protein